MYIYSKFSIKYLNMCISQRICGLYFSKRYFKSRCFYPTYIPRKIMKSNNVDGLITSISTKKQYCSFDVNDDIYIDTEKSVFISFLDSMDKQLYNLICPNVLLNIDAVDPLLNELKDSSTIEEVFETLKKYPDTLTHDQACQAVFSLSLAKNLKKFKLQNTNSVSYLNENFHDSIKAHPGFIRVVDALKENKIQEERIPSLMMCLGNLNLGLDDLMINLHIDALKCIPQLDLSSLAQLSFVFHDKGIKGYYTQMKILQEVNSAVKNCNSVEELRLISVVYLNSKRLISYELFSKYLHTVKRFLNESMFSNSNLNVIILILKLLIVLNKQNPPMDICKSLIKLLHNNIQDLTPPQLIALNAAFLNLQEPRSIMYKIQEYASRLIDTCENLSLKTELLLCLIPSSSFKLKRQYKSLASELITEFHGYQDIGSLYKALRFLKTSDYNLCEAFWLKAMENMKKKLSKADNSIGDKERHLFHIYSKYIYFNNSLGGMFRNRDIEEEITSKLSMELNGPTKYVPTKVAHMIGFLICYSDGKDFKEEWLPLLERNQHQFNKYDVAFLSKGIQMQLFQKWQTKDNIFFLTKLQKILDQITENLLKKCSSLSEVSSLTTAYLDRRGSPSSYLFDALGKEHLNHLTQYNSKSFNLILRNFKIAFYNTPEVFELVSDYLIEHEEDILATTVQRVLSCFYLLGFYPSKGDEFVAVCQRIIESDCERMPCHFVLESCLALSYYKALSSELIHYIFSIQFLDQLDEEILNAHSKNYSPIVRSLLMKLNRAVCLDYPEEKIPWFHEKYCRDQCELKPAAMTPFHTEVLEALSAILGSQNLIRVNMKSHYYYNLDFEFGLNEEGKPVPSPQRANKNGRTGFHGDGDPFKRVAVQLRSERCYSSNDHTLSGHCKLERRHLEILGYVVVEVPQHSWYSMALASAKDKIALLKSLIYKELSLVS